MAAVTDLGAKLQVPFKPAKVLVVDDDLAIGGTIRRYLHRYDIDVADCVQDALRHLERHTYDLLLLDRRLPDGLGDVVVDHVRSRRLSLPILMMSGEIEPQQRHGDSRSRADDFIEKPFVREALVAKIERLLMSHMLRRQAVQQRQELAELHARHAREVEVARTIFDRIFARGEFDPGKVRHLVLAAARLAGDMVFGALTGTDTYRWMIGDVAGHTLASALITMPLAGIFYRTAQQAQPMVDVIEAMECELAAILPANMFCVAALCELNRQSGTLRVWNGGNPPILVRHLDGTVTQIPSNGIPLAADRFAPPCHAIDEYDVRTGDHIYAFSDGLVELRDASDQMLGFERLLAIAKTGPAETIFTRFVACIPERTGVIAYDDDISLIEVTV